MYPKDMYPLMCIDHIYFSMLSPPLLGGHGFDRLSDRPPTIRLVPEKSGHTRQGYSQKKEKTQPALTTMPELISNYERVGIFVRNLLLFFCFSSFFNLILVNPPPLYGTRKKSGVSFFIFPCTRYKDKKEPRHTVRPKEALM